jgi:electron transfer flavoprotein beta subunit
LSEMAELNILVCVKQVPDPEGPPSAFEVDSTAKKVIPRGIPPVLSPFDENALEAAIRVKEACGGTITMISVGSNLSKAVMLKALASGADRLVTVDDASCDQEGLDPFATATLLAAAVRKTGPFDLILTGRQAADTNAGQVGLGLAQLLDIPAVSVAGKIEVTDATVRVETMLPDGYEVVEATLPLLITVSHEVGDLRYPSLMAIKKAKTLPTEALKPADLDVEPASLALNEITELTPPNRERRCRLVEGESPEDAGAKLAAALREDKII